MTSEIISANKVARVIAYMGRAVDAKGNVVGVKGVGKDTAADLVDPHGPRLSFALPLKQAVAQLYQLDLARVNTPEHKEDSLPRLSQHSFRYALEKIGTDVVRNLKNHIPTLKMDTSNIWVNKLKYALLRRQQSPITRFVAEVFDLTNQECCDLPKDGIIPRLGCSLQYLEYVFISQLQKHGLPTENLTQTSAETVQITDLRFPNEYHMLKDICEATIIQIQRTVTRETSTINVHASNQSHPDMIPDYIVHNDFSKKDLEAVLNALINQNTAPRV